MSFQFTRHDGFDYFDNMKLCNSHQFLCCIIFTLFRHILLEIKVTKWRIDTVTDVLFYFEHMVRPLLDFMSSEISKMKIQQVSKSLQVLYEIISGEQYKILLTFINTSKFNHVQTYHRSAFMQRYPFQMGNYMNRVKPNYMNFLSR